MCRNQNDFVRFHASGQCPNAGCFSRILLVTLSKLGRFCWNLLDTWSSPKKCRSIVVHHLFCLKLGSLFQVLALGPKWDACIRCRCERIAGKRQQGGCLLSLSQMFGIVNYSWICEAYQKGIKEATLELFFKKGRQGRTTQHGSKSACITRKWRFTASDIASELHIQVSW